MWNRVVRNAIVVAAIFLLPLAARPDHLRHPAPWLAAAVALVVLMSQPAVDLCESASRDASDRGSALGIFAAMIGAQVASSLQFAAGPAAQPAWTLAGGALLVVTGLALRLWAIRTLGRFFTSTVRVAESHRVVQGGPYQLLRHPSYTGALMTALGTAALLGSTVGAALVAVLCVPAYLYRIATEERALMNALGAEYAEYRSRTWGVLPGLR